MKNSTTAKRLKYLMDKKGWKQVDILNRVEKTGGSISKSALSQYVNDITEPDQDKLTMLAKALDVSETWLMGYDEDESAINKVPDLIAAHFDGEMSDEVIDEINQFIEFIKNKK